MSRPIRGRSWRPTEAHERKTDRLPPSRDDMRYRSLDLWITRESEHRFTVRASWQHGQNHAHLDLYPELLRDDLTRLEEGAVDDELLESFGRRLFHFLFESDRAPVGELLNQCWGASLDDSEEGIRMRLRFEPAEVQSLPWEFLYWPSRRSFMSTSARTALVRYLEVPEAVREMEVALPVRILVVGPAFPDLDTATEVGNLRTALSGLGSTVELRVLDGTVTRNSIRDALRERGYHVVHFIGHGGVDRESSFVLINGTEGPDALREEQLARLVEDHPSLKLVVLNSCQGATVAGIDPFLGMAGGLVARGVPAVVAMQYPIYDRAALGFSREFYRTLLTGTDRGNVEVAVARARSALRADFPATVAFGTPVLFLRAESGVLFDLLTGRMRDDVPLSSARADTLRDVELQRIRNLALLADRAEGGATAAELEEIEREREALGRLRRRLRVGVLLSAVPVTLAALLLLASLVFLLDRPSRLVRADTFTAWLGDRMGEKPFDERIAIVAIDSLDERVAGVPFDSAWRPRVAELVDRLTEAGTRVVALDIFFEATTGRDSVLASAFRRARERGVDVVVGVRSVDDGAPGIASGLRETGVGWGALCVETGAQQHVDLAVRKGDGPWAERSPIVSFALAAVMAFEGARLSEVDFREGVVVLLDDRDRAERLEFAAVEPMLRDSEGCPLLEAGDSVAIFFLDHSRRGVLRDSQRRFRYTDVLEASPTSLASRVGGKLIIVGSTTADLAYSVYPGLSGERRFGFELQADAVSTLLRRVAIRPLAGRWLFVLLGTVAAAGVVAALYPRRHSRRRPVLTLGFLIIALLLGSAYAYREAHVLTMSIYPATALLLGYWSGRMAVRRRLLG